MVGEREERGGEGRGGNEGVKERGTLDEYI